MRLTMDSRQYLKIICRICLLEKRNGETIFLMPPEMNRVRRAPPPQKYEGTRTKEIITDVNLGKNEKNLGLPFQPNVLSNGCLYLHYKPHSVPHPRPMSESENGSTLS